MNKPNNPLTLFSYNKIALYFVILTSLLFSACSSENDKKNTSLSEQSLPTAKATLSPELNTIYKQTCALCHSNSATGAPLSGDTKAWQKVLAKGMDTTLERAMNGYGGMPPAGQCFECTPEEMIELINFMSQQP